MATTKIKARRKPNNPRQITSRALERLETDLDEYGDLSGVIHNTLTGNLVGGNQRSVVFKLEDCEIEIVREFAEPDAQGTTALGFIVWRGHRYTYRRVDWPQEKEDAACIKANRNAGEWDADKLANEWETKSVLEWAGMDDEAWDKTKREAAMWGNMRESEETPAADAEPQIDRAAELQEKWQTRRGQLWAIADHRLLCGDSTNADDVARVMGGEKAGACITDPPWNVGWKYDTYKDELTPEQYKDFCDKWRVNAEKSGAVLFFVALSMKTYKYFSLWFPMAERIFAECQNFTQHTGGFMQYAYNPILVWGENETKAEAGKRDYFVAETSNTKSTPDKELAKINTATRWLPTVEYLVKFSDDGAIIYEPFAGSGTTILACHNLNRKCRAIEISENYTAVCLERLANAFPGIDIHLLD